MIWSFVQRRTGIFLHVGAIYFLEKILRRGVVIWGARNFSLSTQSKQHSYVMWVAAGTENPSDARSELCSEGKKRGLTSLHTYPSVMEGQDRVRESCRLLSPARMRSIEVSINFHMIHGKCPSRENNRLSRGPDERMFIAHSTQGH